VHLFESSEGEFMDEEMVRERDARAYEAVHDAADFTELKRRYKNFVVPWTIAFMAWYLAYVACNNWARGFMSHRIGGSHVNVALIFGLLQFVSTFLIAWLYARHMNTHVDPLARSLSARYDAELHGDHAEQDGSVR
jgi:uncharacterized membrane protein (DUF485 family)